MRNARRSIAFVLAALLGVSGAESARAQLVVVATPGEPPAIAHAELAYAAGEGRPVTWLSLRIARGPVALVAALPTDAVADAALDAWFIALEVTASPNVLLPLDRAGCGQASRFVHVAWPRAAGVAAEELSVQSPDDVAAALDEHGLKLENELPPAERYLIWSWPAVDAAQTTRTLRIAGGATPLSLLPGSAFPLLVSSVTRGSAALPTELFNRELPVTFMAQERPATDYVERLQDWLVSRPEPLLETRGRGSLFDWAIYDDSLSLASLVSSYATRGAKEMPGIDPDACAAQLRALRNADAPSAAACGDASDLSWALSAAGSELTTLQRFVVSGAHGFSPANATEGGVPSAPVLRAQRLDDTGCNVQGQPPQVIPPPAPSGGKGTNGTTTVVVEETTVVVDDTGHGEASCGGSPQPEPQDNGCGSDTTSSDSTDSGCASDSSSGSDTSSDSGCASDSSSGSDTSSDSGCASDSSSSSDSTDSGCSKGSDENGYDGDTCTGAAAPGGERAEKAQAGLSSRPSRHRPRRLKTSLWSMAFVALVLPIRRRKRGPFTGG